MLLVYTENNLKYYIHTFGCKVNQYESQLISDKFKKDNFERTAKSDEADVIIINSCTVTAKADKECEYFLRKFSNLTKKPDIILTGCFAKNKTDYLKKTFPSINVVDDKSNLFVNPDKQLITQFEKRSRAFVKIQDGCNSFCSYCIVPYVRNILWSKPQNIVIEEISKLADNGYSEIVLTGIHVGKYEGGVSNLLKQIIKIQKDFRVRISSIELNEIDDELIRLLKDNSDKICRHLHIPLQSGSNSVLKSMNRQYTASDYENKINSIIKVLPDLALTTDIITGFPKESEKHHKEMCDFITRNPFARFHIFRYSDREGTVASKFESKVSVDEIKKRSKELFEIDLVKRKGFLQKNTGQLRKAVSIGHRKALTDNYITVKTDEIKNGIFDIKITENAEV